MNKKVLIATASTPLLSLGLMTNTYEINGSLSNGVDKSQLKIK